MQPETGIKTWQWVVSVIVIIVLIVIGIMIFGNKGPKAPVDNTANTPVNTAVTNGVQLTDQYPGNVVYLSSVSLQSPGWVVIHKDNAGTPGVIIGSVFVPAGISPAKVTVTSPIVDGSTYYAVLHSDNGDGKFDATTDLPLKDASGNIIMRAFKGSVSAGDNVKG